MSTLVAEDSKTDLEKKFQKLFQDGKLIQVHVSRWHMTAQLQENDLELKEDAKIPGFVQSLGKKNLFDADTRNKFSRIEGRARAYLKAQSYKFPICDAHFVPRKKLTTVLTELNKIKTEFEKEVTAFIESYDKKKEEMLEKYKDHREQLEPYYPPAATVLLKFGFSVSMFEVAMPKQMKELTMTELLAQNEAVEQMSKQYEAQVQNFVSEAVTALRAQVVEVFETIAKKISEKEVLSDRSIKPLRNIIQEFEELDFFDDSSVKQKLGTVKALLDDGNQDFKENHKSINRLQEAVKDVLSVTKEASDVDKISGNYFRRIDLD